MSRFSAPINPERPRGEPSCAKCAHLVTASGIPTCPMHPDGPRPCEQFCDASVERTARRSLKAGYDVATRPA